MKANKETKNVSKKETAIFESVVLNLCREFGFKCKFTDCDLIFITTKCGHWMLICEGEYIEVYHNNHKPGMGVLLNSSSKFNSGYHRQKEIKNTKYIREVIEYIYEHERNYLNAGYIDEQGENKGKRGQILQ